MPAFVPVSADAYISIVPPRKALVPVRMNVHRIAFGSSISHCAELRRIVQAFARIEGYSMTFKSELELTVHEAFVNAVLHGNGSNPELPVSITFIAGLEARGGSLQVEVRDCGEGFDSLPLRDFSITLAEPSLSGRGVPLMAHFSESLRVEKHRDGSVLILSYIPH